MSDSVTAKSKQQAPITVKVNHHTIFFLFFFISLEICLELSTVGDLDLRLGLAGRGALLLNDLNQIHALAQQHSNTEQKQKSRFCYLGDLSKDDVLAVEPSGDDSGDEKLRSVGAWTSIGHAQQTGTVVLELEVLIRKLLAID